MRLVRLISILESKEFIITTIYESGLWADWSHHIQEPWGTKNNFPFARASKNLPLDKKLFNCACPGQVLVCSFNDFASRCLAWSLARPANKNENAPVQDITFFKLCFLINIIQDHNNILWAYCRIVKNLFINPNILKFYLLMTRIKYKIYHTSLILKNAFPVNKLSLPAWCWGPTLSS